MSFRWALACVNALASAACLVVAFVGDAQTGEALVVIGTVWLLAIATVSIIYRRSGSVHGTK